MCQVSISTSPIIIPGQEQIKATEQSSLIYTQKKEIFIILSCMLYPSPSKYLCMNENIELSGGEKRKKKSFIAFVVVGVSFSCNMLPEFKLHCCCCCFSLRWLFFLQCYPSS